ncbi:MAG TPA: VOC family protein, partial [Planctomycetota bacterium]|nr:VOC family protein [Planctomycetota bacterium]
SGDFYARALGFRVEPLAPGWSRFSRDACTILAGACPDAPPAASIGDHSYFAYLVVDDADAELARALAAGARVTKAIRDEPWGMREFGVRTVDGHRIMLGQPLA